MDMERLVEEVDLGKGNKRRVVLQSNGSVRLESYKLVYTTGGSFRRFWSGPVYTVEELRELIKRIEKLLKEEKK